MPTISMWVAVWMRSSKRSVATKCCDCKLKRLRLKKYSCSSMKFRRRKHQRLAHAKACAEKRRAKNGYHIHLAKHRCAKETRARPDHNKGLVFQCQNTISSRRFLHPFDRAGGLPPVSHVIQRKSPCLPDLECRSGPRWSRTKGCIHFFRSLSAGTL